jgi:hypothetical protein
MGIEALNDAFGFRGLDSVTLGDFRKVLLEDFGWIGHDAIPSRLSRIVPYGLLAVKG